MSRKSNPFRVGKVQGYLRGKVWYLSYHEHGKRQRPRVAPSREAARQLAAQVNAQMEVGAPAVRPDTPRGNTDRPDPMAAAEALKAQLTEVLARTARLIAILKEHRKESQAVKAALTSLSAGLSVLQIVRQMGKSEPTIRAALKHAESMGAPTTDPGQANESL